MGAKWEYTLYLHNMSLDISVSEDLPFLSLGLQESHLDGVQLDSDSHRLVAKSFLGVQLC